MLNLGTVAVYLCLSFTVHICTSSSKLSTLKQVHVIFRHGDRTPIGPTFPLDPHNSHKSWPDGWGQLTNAGKRAQYDLGRYLRSRYKGFLSKKYATGQVFVTTSDLDRTITSALVNLAGMFPAEESDFWNKDVNWHPIPIHTLHSKIDNKINFVPNNCPKYKLRLEQIMNSPLVQNVNAHYQDLYKNLTAFTGRSVTDFLAVSEIFDALIVTKENGMALPDWTKSVFPEKMAPLSLLQFELLTFTDEMTRLRAGPLVNEILKRMELESETDRAQLTVSQEHARSAKLYMYSGHDTTVTTVLSALGAYDKLHIPGYTATVIIELHDEHSNGGSFPAVKIFYRNNSELNPPLLQVRGCENTPEMTCSLARFKEVLSEFNLDEIAFQLACQLTHDDEYYTFPTEDAACRSRYFTLKDAAESGNLFLHGIYEYIQRLIFFR